MRVQWIVTAVILLIPLGGAVINNRVRVAFFDACSAFTHAGACTLALSPIRAMDMLTAKPEMSNQTCAVSNPNFGQGNDPPANSRPRTADGLTRLGSSPASPAEAKRPNIIFVLADDLSLDLVQCMPHVLKMQKDGVTFANYFVTDSLCCPSRSSIFTSHFPHNTGIYLNSGPDGGYLEFLKRGLEDATFVSALTTAGYHTAMLGKYLNGYKPQEHRVAPWWNEWDVDWRWSYRRDCALFGIQLRPQPERQDCTLRKPTGGLPDRRSFHPGGELHQAADVRGTVHD